MAIPFYSRYTFHYHIRAQVLEGSLVGIWTLNEIVARKAFHANEWWIMLMVMMPAVSLLFASPCSFLIGRKGSKIFLWSGIVRLATLPLAALAFAPSYFSIALALSALSWALFYPAQNSVFQSNYSASLRGRLYGIGSATAALMTIVISLSAGYLYDLEPSLFRVTYPLAGIFGFGSCYLYHKIHQRQQNYMETAKAKPWGGVTLLKENKSFLLFEIAFMTYGTAFMMMMPLLPLYLVDVVKVKYVEASWVKSLVFQGMLLISAPLAGKFLDRVGIVRLSILAFLLLAFYPLVLLFSTSISGAIISFAIFGFAMGMVDVAWSMGPIAFAGKRESTPYMGVHATLAGVRSLYAYPLGVLLRNLSSSYTVPFLTASILFLCACIVVSFAGSKQHLK